MDLRDLQYSEVIAELEHMGRAAERLHRKQPALTSSREKRKRWRGQLRFCLVKGPVF